MEIVGNRRLLPSRKLFALTGNRIYTSNTSELHTKFDAAWKSLCYILNRTICSLAPLSIFNNRLATHPYSARLSIPCPPAPRPARLKAVVPGAGAGAPRPLAANASFALFRGSAWSGAARSVSKRCAVKICCVVGWCASCVCVVSDNVECVEGEVGQGRCEEIFCRRALGGRSK